jgi:hypothetical protein
MPKAAPVRFTSRTPLITENKGLYNAINLQKKKGRTRVRLNLGGQPNKEIINCYSPDFVVKCWEYYEEKEAINAAKEQAKLNHKIKRAANTLRKKLEAVEKAKRAEERTTKAAEKQLAKDLAVVNKPAQKTRKEQPNGTVTKAKKSALIVSKEHKVANKARPRGKLPVRSAVVVLVEGEVASGVVVAKTATRSIKRPSRYVQ